jgi:hypothetical protein
MVSMMEFMFPDLILIPGHLLSPSGFMPAMMEMLMARIFFKDQIPQIKTTGPGISPGTKKMAPAEYIPA